jgi:hypothetical protein
MNYLRYDLFMICSLILLVAPKSYASDFLKKKMLRL